MSSYENSQSPQNDLDPEQKRRKSQLKLLGIFAVATLPVVAAFVMYFGGVGVPGNTTNKGELIWPPAELSVLGEADTSASSIVKAEQKWFLMLSGSGPCDAECKKHLHTMRQVHVSMGRELERVGRILLGQSQSEREELSEIYPKLKFAQLPQELHGSAAQILSGDSSNKEAWSIWLIDPLGNVLLRYGSEHTGYDMIADLKKLLKLSNIG